MTKTSNYPLIIIGAGAAGLAASEMATRRGVKHRVLEASHRTGGRGLTEILSDQYPVDLGCHWLHSGSINPYTEWATKLGFDYSISRWDFSMFIDGAWYFDTDATAPFRYIDEINARMEACQKKGDACSQWELADSDNKWNQFFQYWVSLMSSVDADQVSILDICEYLDTHEDWPVMKGYGALIARQGVDCPVDLNCVVTKINWGDLPISIETSQGVITADRVVITASTGVLNAGDIEFNPKLPGWKMEAINALPLGNSNYTFCTFEPDAIDPDAPNHILWQRDDQTFWVRLREFGHPYAFTSTGGRFAWWLEKQGQDASIELFSDVMVDIFGSRIRDKLSNFKVSAWGMDPWIRGAYSAAQPGKTGMRAELARCIDDRLFFAGEATSPESFSTAHGAYQSGYRAINQVCDSLS